VIDGRVDLYSLSAVLFRILTGKYYIDFETCITKARIAAINSNEEVERQNIFNQVCNYILETNPTNPKTYRTEIPDLLQFNILKGLAKRPGDRFQSGSEMANALSACLKIISDKNVEDDLKKVQILLNEGNLDKAADVAQTVLRKDDNNSSAHEFMGEIHRRRGEYSSAILQWEKAIQLPACTQDIYLKLGRLYSRMKNLGAALRAYQKGLEYNPEDYTLLYEMAVTHWNMGNHSTAIEALADSCRLHFDKRKEALLTRWGEENHSVKQYTEGDTLHG
jgi:tetratricopeptide (TPR) repeat protein